MPRRRVHIAALLGLAASALGCRDYSQINFGTEPAVDAAVEKSEDAPAEAGSRYPHSESCATPTPLPPSCAGGLTCGGESCCTQCLVAGGSFDRGWDSVIGTNPTDPITQPEGAKIEPLVGAQHAGAASTSLDAFELDRFEVTLGRFRAFYKAYASFLKMHPKDVDGGGYKNGSVHWHDEWTGKAGLYAQTPGALLASVSKCDAALGAGLDAATSALDNRPMACVSFYEAYLFCIYDGAGRIPTEAEWNFAAADGSMGRPYPWGTPDPLDVPADHGNILRAGGGASVDVGTFPLGVGRWGHLDLAGNVWELVFDTTDNDGDLATYVVQPVDAVMLSLPGETHAYTRIARGGSFGYGAAHARTAYRMAVNENGFQEPLGASRFSDLGWRCAR
jgi:formylglycine-generating enzyme